MPILTAKQREKLREAEQKGYLLIPATGSAPKLRGAWWERCCEARRPYAYVRLGKRKTHVHVDLTPARLDLPVDGEEVPGSPLRALFEEYGGGRRAEMRRSIHRVSVKDLPAHAVAGFAGELVRLLREEETVPCEHVHVWPDLGSGGFGGTPNARRKRTGSPRPTEEVHAFF